MTPEPLLDVGVVTGQEPYQLDRAESSTLLPDGRIAVVNSGSNQVRIFDRDGRFVRQFGRAGDGPGEFGLAARIRSSGDTLRVWDQRLRRFSTFDTAGTLLATESVPQDPAEPFPLDVWLYRRNLVDSPVPPAVRGALAVGIDNLPPVDSTAAARYLLVTEQGRIWAADTIPPAHVPVGWEVHELDGAIRARIRTPAGFEPHEIGPDYVLGRWLDDLDVNHIRLYRLEKPTSSPPGPGLEAIRRSGRPLTPIAGHEPVELGVLASMKATLKNMASMEEINYADHGTYTTEIGDFGLQVPEDVRVDILQAHSAGWTAFITHRPTGAFCVMTYGLTVPMGWWSGRVACVGT